MTFGIPRLGGIAFVGMNDFRSGPPPVFRWREGE
jgi:hypothetical protein